MVVKENKSDKESALIFLPTEVDNSKNIFLHGEIKIVDNTINIYITGTYDKFCDRCLGSYSTKYSHDESEPSVNTKNWIQLWRGNNDFTLKKFKINGKIKCCDNVGVVVIYYDREIFIELRNSLFSKKKSEISMRDHFRYLMEKLKQDEKQEKSFLIFDKLLNLFRYIILFFSIISNKLFIITKYSSIASHVNYYLSGLIWMTECKNVDHRECIKKLNFLFSIILDIVFGAVISNILSQYFPTDSLPKFLLSGKVVQMLKDLINWLMGNPAGFKLNYTFSKLLATFFLFYIDIWCTFLDILRPAYKTILLIFLVIGKAGITFQASIIEDVLTVLTFHIYCICLFAARLYNIQISASLALWRLFLGRKKNPLRGRVDSCKYTPEQLFIGTLGFTILLFLLPTTLIYYVVFTFLRIILTSCKKTLRQIRYLVQSLQLYSIILWITASPKVSSGIKLIQYKSLLSRNCLVFHAKPVCTSLTETLANGELNFLDKPEDFKFSEFLYSLLIGRVKHN